MSGVHTRIALSGGHEAEAGHPPSEVERLIENHLSERLSHKFLILDRADGKGNLYIDPNQVVAFAELV